MHTSANQTQPAMADKTWWILEDTSTAGMICMTCSVVMVDVNSPIRFLLLKIKLLVKEQPPEIGSLTGVLLEDLV